MLHTFQKTNERNKTFLILFFRWRHDLMPTYIRNVLQLFQHMLIDDHFGKESIEVNVMFFSCRPKTQIANKTWFDDECFILKKKFK